eukprot:6461707-Amphidinium_carterae.2
MSFGNKHNDCVAMGTLEYLAMDGSSICPNNLYPHFLRNLQMCAAHCRCCCWAFSPKCCGGKGIQICRCLLNAV